MNVSFDQVQAIGAIVVGAVLSLFALRGKSIKALREEVAQLRADVEWERSERDNDNKNCSDAIQKLRDEVAVLRGENNVLIGGIGDRIGIAAVEAVVKINETIHEAKRNNN